MRLRSGGSRYFGAGLPGGSGDMNVVRFPDIYESGPENGNISVAILVADGDSRLVSELRAVLEILDISQLQASAIVSDADEALEKVFTLEQCLAVAQALFKQAKKGSISHVQEAANRLEGKVESSDESAGGVSLTISSGPTKSSRNPAGHFHGIRRTLPRNGGPWWEPFKQS
jgi:hypothetical protein